MGSVKNSFSIDSIDKSSRLSLSSFNGKSYLGIFSSGSSDNQRFPVSIWMSSNLRFFLKKHLKNLLNNKKPNEVHSIILSFFNRDVNTMEKTAVITLRTTEDSKPMIELVIHPISSFNERLDQSLLKKDHVFRFTVPKAIELSDNPMDDYQRNQYGAMIFLEELSNMHVAEAISSIDVDNNNGFQKHPQPQPQLQSTKTQPQVDDDIPF